MTAAAIVFAAQFVYILLLGLQQLNVVGRHYTAAAGVSLLLGVTGYHLTATVAIHAEQSIGSAVWLAYIAGGPIGIVVSMWINPRLRSWIMGGGQDDAMQAQIEDQAYWAGYDAYKRGHRERANPHKQDSELYRAWLRGMLAAHKDSQMPEAR